LRSPSNNGDAQLDAQFHVMDLQAIQERQEGIRKIERDVTELAEMFKDLQTLVVQQQDSLNVVEENVQRTKAETEQGLKELQEAERLQNKARKRMCFILAILVIILAVIVLIALGVTGNL
jgi:t-SNARE complex subunit (syntaxin)